MNKRIVVFIIIVNIFMFFNLSFAGPGEEVIYVKNRLLVKVNENTLDTPRGTFDENGTEFSDTGRLQSVLLNKYHTEIKTVQWKQQGSYYILEAGNDCDVEVICEKLRQEPFVVDAAPDYYASLTSVTPNDPFFQYQYALSNTGQVYYPDESLTGTFGSDISALEGWEWTTGSEDVVIAIVDTGVEVEHEDLKNKIVPGYNIVEHNNDPYDDFGHGTFVASIAAAETNNGIGIAGVSWKSKIMPIKAFIGGLGTSTDISDGIRYAVDHNAQVINLSLGFSKGNFVLEEACKYAFDRGAILVAATGNYNSEVLYPAAYDQYCLAVGASDANDQRWGNSNYGPSIDVVAPGVDVLGALFKPREPDVLNAYKWGSGTSYATPYAAGAAALLIAYKPFLTNSQVMDLIKFTADDVNSSTYPGIDEFIGFGRINLKRLLGPYVLK